jgi:hypothetical protein
MTGGEPGDKARRDALVALLASLGLGEAALAQGAAGAQAPASRVVLDNDRLRVLDVNSKPGMGVCGNGMHSHPAHLTIALSDGTLRVRRPDGHVDTAQVKLGDAFFGEAESHEVLNTSGKEMRALLVELKTPGRAPHS